MRRRGKDNAAPSASRPTLKTRPRSIFTKASAIASALPSRRGSLWGSSFSEETEPFLAEKRVDDRPLSMIEGGQLLADMVPMEEGLGIKDMRASPHSSGVIDAIADFFRLFERDGIGDGTGDRTLEPHLESGGDRTETRPRRQGQGGVGDDAGAVGGLVEGPKAKRMAERLPPFILGQAEHPHRGRDDRVRATPSIDHLHRAGAA